MNETRMAAFDPNAPGWEEIAERENQLREIDGRIAQTARQCCEDIEKHAPLTWIEANVALLEGMFHSRRLIIDELKRAGGYVTEAYERRRRA